MEGGDRSMKQWLIGGLIVLVLLGSYFYNKNKSNNDEFSAENQVSAEEILVQEDGSLVKKIGDVVEKLSNEEIIAKKQEIEDKVNDTTATMLNASSEDRNISGDTKRVFVDGVYYQKISVSGLDTPEKGYYYEAWLQDDQGNNVSIGRVELSGSDGVVYYTAKEDKSKYSKVLISKEQEGGSSNPDMIILEGTISN